LDAGISQTHFTKIEDGKVMPRLDTARKVAKALDATLDEAWPVESE
jgi:DNA-binding XRE family transcriptional regulator